MPPVATPVDDIALHLGDHQRLGARRRALETAKRKRNAARHRLRLRAWTLACTGIAIPDIAAKIAQEDVWHESAPIIWAAQNKQVPQQPSTSLVHRWIQEQDARATALAQTDTEAQRVRADFRIDILERRLHKVADVAMERFEAGDAGAGRTAVDATRATLQAEQLRMRLHGLDKAQARSALHEAIASVVAVRIDLHRSRETPEKLQRNVDALEALPALPKATEADAARLLGIAQQGGRHAVDAREGTTPRVHDAIE